MLLRLKKPDGVWPGIGVLGLLVLIFSLFVVDASAQTTPLVISKSGIGADIYQFAHVNSFFYGLASVIVALLAGWIAHLVFRRI